MPKKQKSLQTTVAEHKISNKTRNYLFHTQFVTKDNISQQLNDETMPLNFQNHTNLSALTTPDQRTNSFATHLILFNLGKFPRIVYTLYNSIHFPYLTKGECSTMYITLRYSSHYTIMAHNILFDILDSILYKSLKHFNSTVCTYKK